VFKANGELNWAFEKATAGGKFHGVAEEGIAFRDTAEVIGKRLNIPVVAKLIILAGLQISPDSTARPQPR
jgi:hypothetical protein